MSSREEPALILASTSVYRRRLLDRLGVPFQCVSPDVDEDPEAGEGPEALARRLGAAKALAVATNRLGVLVVGSDQVACIGEQIYGKPGDAATARAQLQRSSGATVRFYTSVALARDGMLVEERCVPTDVHFRSLSDQEIDDYIRREKPFDCAGSFRWEGLGIALFTALRSDDPTALEGLPLIATSAMLRNNGINPLIIS